MTEPTSSGLNMKPLPLTLVLAATPSHGIGLSSTLPWSLRKEMLYFAKLTTQAPAGTTNGVIMGRKSWEGIPPKWRPLKNRRNVVVSRAGVDLSDAPDTHPASSLPAAASLLSSPPPSASVSSLPLHRAFLIGGAQLYSHALSTPSHPSYSVNRILLTRLSTDLPCDTFVPELEGVVNSASGEWRQASHAELSEWAGFEAAEGEQVEEDRTGKGEVRYRFEMWVKGSGEV